MGADDYFELVAAMLTIYAVVRVGIWLELRNDFRPPSSRPSNIHAHPINTSPLTHRLEEVRRNYAAEALAHPPSPKTPLLVKEQRAQIAKLAFFQKSPPEPEPPEQEQGLLLLTL